MRYKGAEIEMYLKDGKVRNRVKVQRHGNSPEFAMQAKLRSITKLVNSFYAYEFDVEDEMNRIGDDEFCKQAEKELSEERDKLIYQINCVLRGWEMTYTREYLTRDYSTLIERITI